MARCEACGTRILFGAVKHGEHRYCSAKCVKEAAWIFASKTVPDAEVEREVRSVHQGICPKCKGPGPIDVHTSHKVYSVLVLTSWSSHPIIACRACGHKQQLKHAIYSFVMGWWGFPFGLIATPVQVIKNVGGMIGLTGPDPSTPSPALTRAVRLTLAARKRSGTAPPAENVAGKKS